MQNAKFAKLTLHWQGHSLSDIHWAWTVCIPVGTAAFIDFWYTKFTVYYAILYTV